jgi:hypothetical protein
VSATKEKFFTGYKKPMSAVYTTVVQELLVQQHLIRYNKNYQYDEVCTMVKQPLNCLSLGLVAEYFLKVVSHSFTC